MHRPHLSASPRSMVAAPIVTTVSRRSCVLGFCVHLAQRQAAAFGDACRVVYEIDGLP